jgi:hypothetical protein
MEYETAASPRSLELVRVPRLLAREWLLDDVVDLEAVK